MSTQDSNPKPEILAIPETSPTRYISGIVALNIPCEAGTGDWHEENVFFTPRVRIPRSFIIERGQEVDPSEFFGGVGIYDAAPALDSIGVKHPGGPVFAASHTRAIADLVLVSILRGESTGHVSQIDDWLHTYAQMQEVLSIVELAIPRVSQEQQEALAAWIERNFGRPKAVALNSFSCIADRWGLSQEERATILSARPENQMERISYVLGIFSGLQTVLGETPLADEWVTRPNSDFSGRRPLDRMLTGNIDDVRMYVDQWVSGD